MQNLIRAQKYQLKRDKVTRWIWTLFLGSLVVYFVSYMRNESLSELTGSHIPILLGEMNMIIMGIFVILITARVMGWDYTDKTLNYELMAGHSRGEVYLSRVFLSLVLNIVGCAIYLFLPLLLFGVINGWGYTTDMGNILLRYGLSFLPLFRLVGECVLLTVLLKNCYMVMIIGYVLYYSSMVIMLVLEPLVDLKWTTQFCFVNFMKLLYMDKCRLQYINGEDVQVYQTALESELLTGTIGVSLIVGIACLGLGYLYFKKSDMN